MTTLDQSPPLLEVKSVSKEFGGIRAVDDVSAEIFPGELVGLIGPNGAGKTTLFNLISGFAAPSAGTIVWKGADVSRLDAAGRARLGLVRTFQNARVFPGLTVRENLALGAHRFQAKPIHPEGRRWPLRRAEAHAAGNNVAEALARLGYENVAHAAAGVLSYGQAKRLGVAIAVMCQPSLLLLDEPAAGLNTDEVETLRQDLSIMTVSGITIVLVEHHMGLVMTACGRVIVLDAGRMIAEGPPEQIANDPAVIGAYLGA